RPLSTARTSGSRNTPVVRRWTSKRDASATSRCACRMLPPPPRRSGASSVTHNRLGPLLADPVAGMAHDCTEPRSDRRRVITAQVQLPRVDRFLVAVDGTPLQDEVLGGVGRHLANTLRLLPPDVDLVLLTDARRTAPTTDLRCEPIRVP